MPFFAWLGTLGAGLTSWFARKGSVVALYTATFLGFLGVYYACIGLIRDAIALVSVDLATASGTVTAGGSTINWTNMVGMWVPSNLDDCIIIVMDALVCRAAFLLVKRHIEVVAQAN